MEEVTIYHNPRCRKSREALQVLENTCKQIHVIDYLKTPPTEKQLEEIIKKLGMPAENLVRKGELVYKDNYKGKTMSEKDWIKAMVENPILIERPIVIRGNMAVVARPSEKVSEIL